LQSIRGWAQLLATGRLNQDVAKRAFESIERNVQLQAQLIEDLLDASRIVTGKLSLNLQPVDLVPVIQAAIDTASPAAAAKAIQLSAAIDRSGCLVVGDSKRLQQIVGNLLSNAIKFTPACGRVEVRLSVEMGHGALGMGHGALGMGHGALGMGHGNQENGQCPVPSTQCPIPYAQIQVADTGIGISPDFLPYVFERFRQAEGITQHGGLGLGLAIVRHLVELHGGTVSAESPGLGQGATFTAKLPLR
jgi:signal transduction histidine kinase